MCTSLPPKTCIMCKAELYMYSRYMHVHVYCLPCRSIVSQFLNNLKETKLKIYKSVFVSAIISSELFKHKGQ